MDIKQFKTILKEFEKSTIHKLEITEKDFTVKMEKRGHDYHGQISNLTDKDLSIDPIKVTSNKTIENTNYEVKSPLVGTFYDSPSPESQSFVKEGQSVQKGDVLFIVEAMKVMNEIRSPISGIIRKILPTSQSMVEYGQIICEIEQEDVS